MVHAPHMPMPQPNFVPTSSSESRSTQRSGVSGATSTVRDWPLTFREYLLMVERRSGVERPARRERVRDVAEPRKKETAVNGRPRCYRSTAKRPLLATDVA